MSSEQIPQSPALEAPVTLLSKPGDRAPVKFITPAELSTITAVPERTLENWRRSGTGPRFTRLGRRVRYELGDVHAWLRRCVVGPRDAGR
jgi:hypothetical protein